MRTVARVVALWAILVQLAASASAMEIAKALLDKGGVKMGLCLHLGCGQAGNEGLTADLAASSRMLIHGLALDDAACDRVRASIQRRGLQGQAQDWSIGTGVERGVGGAIGIQAPYVAAGQA